MSTWGQVMTLKFTCRRVASTIYKTASLIGILLVGSLHAAQNSKIIYMPGLSPDGGRVAIAKWQESTGWELFEGIVDQRFRKLRMPAGHRAGSSILYSPDGKSLLFLTVPERSSAKLPIEKSEQANAESTTLWKQHISDDEHSTPQKILESPFSITSVLPLTDGSLVFMGKVEEIKSQSWSPITGSNRVWSTYKWMLRKPDGTVDVISPRAYAYFSIASLIRDEVVFVIQERHVNRQPTNPSQYYLDITALKPGVDLSVLERLGNMQDRRGGPRLQCDWAGKTCARLMVFDKDGYYAHQLEIIRDGKVCKVDGLPDRAEQMAISRSGNAVTLIAQPTPRKSGGYKLAHLIVNADGCAGDRKFLELP